MCEASDVIVECLCVVVVRVVEVFDVASDLVLIVVDVDVDVDAEADVVRCLSLVAHEGFDVFDERSCRILAL